MSAGSLEELLSGAEDTLLRVTFADGAVEVLNVVSVSHVHENGTVVANRQSVTSNAPLPQATTIQFDLADVVKVQDPESGEILFTTTAV